MREPLPAHKRAEILVRVAGALGKRHDEVARVISDEAGKPLKAAKIEASRAMSTYTFAAVEARKLAGDVVPMDASQSGEGKLAFTLRTPIGVVGAISPFNFPLNLVAHKIAPALAAGCAVVLKPAGQTPLSALLLAELEDEAGLPPGWLNVVVGPASEIGDALIEDERVKAITFTGSSGVGWKLRERAPREARQPRARQLDAAHRRSGRRHRGRRRRDGPARLLVRRPELHLDPARLHPARRLRRLRPTPDPEGGRAGVGRPGGGGHGRRPRDRRGRPRPDPRVDRGGARRRRGDPHRRRARGRADPSHCDRERRARPEGLVRGGLRAGRHGQPYDSLDEASSSPTARGTASRRGSSRRTCGPPFARPRSSSSAA